MLKYSYVIQVLCSLEINEKMGFGKSHTREKLLITNGQFPVPFTLHFENKLIDPVDATEIGNIAVKCPFKTPMEIIDQLNENLVEKFVSAFQNPEMDQKIRNRGERGVLATAGLTIGLAAAEKLIGKGIDYLFDSKRRKSEQVVNELKDNLYTIKNQLELSSLELCALGQNVLQEKINRISLELSLDIENQIKSELQNLYFGKLNNKFQLDACLALNKQASQLDCLNILRACEFDFKIIAVEVYDDHASIQLQIMTPILSKILIGFNYHNFGVPKQVNNKNVLIKGSIPDFVSENAFYKFRTVPKYGVISQQDILSDTNFDLDCFKNTSDSDHLCDAIISDMSANFLIETIQGESFLVNFIQCSYTLMNKFDDPIFLEPGVHHIKLEFGFLTCGQERLEFNHVAIHLRSRVSYNNYSIPFNYIDRNTFQNIYNRNIFDHDHVLEQVDVLPNISFRIIIIFTLFVILIVIVILLYAFYKQSIRIKQQLIRPALIY